MTRAEYREQLQLPLLNRFLEKEKLFVFEAGGVRAGHQ